MTAIEPHLSRASRLRGGIIGLLIGDALGVPYEFHPREEIPSFGQIDFDPPVGYDRAHPGVPPGTYSDDGAQALVLLDSLLTRGALDLDHFGEGLVRWCYAGYLAVDQRVFDVGIRTSAALARVRSGVPVASAGGSDERSNGNGGLMRVLPLALWHPGSDIALVLDALAQSSVTHGHDRSKMCCALYCLWARRILEGADDPWASAVAALRSTLSPDSPVIREFETIIVANDDPIRGSGYVVDSLRAAVWANRNDSFEKVVKDAVSLGDDTDTTASIAGGIAGLRFGEEAIPAHWRARLRGRALYEPLVERLVQVAG